MRCGPRANISTLRFGRGSAALVFSCMLLATAAVAAEHALPAPYSAAPTLPAPYSAFSKAEAVRDVFPSYDSATSSVAELQTYNHKRAGIAWAEAKTWNARGRPYLVVLFNVNPAASRPDICGVCPQRFAIAVLTQSKGQLHLVARGLTQNYGGHRDAQLDLAPYHLTAVDMLIGLRVTHIWFMAHRFNTRLELYRPRGSNLDLVFRTTVVDRQYPTGMQGATLAKLSSIISMENARPFYTLRLDRTIYLCRNLQDKEINDRFVGTSDCDVNAKASQQVWRDISEWKFDGLKFVQQDLDAYFDSGGN